MSLNRNLSKEIVCELERTLGHTGVLRLLGITSPRLQAFLCGRGALKDEQLLKITNQTGKSWMRWGMEAAAESAPNTAENRKFLAATYEMIDRIDPTPVGRNVNKPRRSKSGRAALKKAS